MLSRYSACVVVEELLFEVSFCAFALGVCIHEDFTRDVYILELIECAVTIQVVCCFRRIFEMCGGVKIKRQERAKPHGLSATLATPQAFLPSSRPIFEEPQLCTTVYAVTGETDDS